MPETHTHSMWMGIGEKVISFVIGTLVAAFFLGGARQRMNDVAKWREVTEPRIERMDRSGTVSFEHFQTEYNKTQTRQEKKLEELETRIRQVEIK